MSDRPNVVLVCADQWRGDCLSAEGHPVLSTPHLDRLAGQGVRFRQAYSATPTCVPARAALMTGLSQRSHGRVGYQDGVPWTYETTLAGEFGRHGYQTQAIGKMHTYPERARLGFDDVLLHDGYLHFARRRGRAVEEYDDYVPWLRAQPGVAPYADYVDDGVQCNSVVARPWDKPEATHPTTWVVTEAIRWLYRRDPTVPFLLYLSFVRPHPPYDPPAWAFEQYLHAPLYDPPVGDWAGEFDEHREDHRPDAFVARYDERTLHRARAGYHGHMAHIDLQLSRLLDALGEFGLTGDTYVAFTSDHGEMLGDHHMFRKGYPYEGSARVPLLLAGPPESGMVPGEMRQEIVELRDVMPTLLDCAALPVPDSLEGRSLLPLARGEKAQWREHLHGEHAVLGQSLQWVRWGRFKYVWCSGSGHEQLFDLADDPTELTNLARDPRHADTLAFGRGLLVRDLRGREEGYVRRGRLVPGRPAQTVLRSVTG